MKLLQELSMKDNMKAKVFKVETFGAVDGPGVRLVIFLQGCSFRCKYCHNPESWDTLANNTTEISVAEIIEMFERNKSFYANGGITLSGGEPMMQADFIKELAKECKKHNIHLAIDTAATTFMTKHNDYLDLLDLVDLWIVDIKATNPEEHKMLTGDENLTGMNLVTMLEQNQKPYWIRNVIIKDFNTDFNHIISLVRFVKPLMHLRKFQFLPFHKLATEKYEKLGIEYPFKDKQLLSKEEIDKINNDFNVLLNKTR